MGKAELPDRVSAALAQLLDDGQDMSIEALKAIMRHGSGQGHGERIKANGRTVTYKLRQTLAGAPESEDVMMACGYLMLGLIERFPERAAARRDEIVSQLTSAGFAPDQSVKVIDRLAADVAGRRADWHRRLRLRAIRRLVAALPKETGVTHTG